MVSRKRVGLLGGSFNPVHRGHIAIADAARGLFSLDEIWFMPCSVSPFKVNAGLAAAEERLDMLECAIKGLSWASITDLELARGGVSYAFDTVVSFRDKYPASDPWFIIGMDTLLELHQWYRAEELVEICDFATLMRPGYNDLPTAAELCFSDSVSARLLRNIARGPEVDISSTQVRETAARGDSLSSLLPPGVGEYIREKGLYRLLRFG